MTPWDSIAAEYGDVLQSRRKLQKRPCAGGCGRQTQASSGICLTCAPSLFDEPTESPASAQIGVDDPWPEDMF